MKALMMITALVVLLEVWTETADYSGKRRVCKALELVIKRS